MLGQIAISKVTPLDLKDTGIRKFEHHKSTKKYICEYVFKVHCKNNNIFL